MPRPAQRLQLALSIDKVVHTDCVCSGTLYELEVPSRDCHVGLRPPRNDNSEVHTILTMACTDRQHCAGHGCPLPYNARLAALRKIPRSAFHVFFHKFSLSCA